MGKIEIKSDRTIFSTDNNGLAGNERDENLVAENLWNSEIPTDDKIPAGINEDTDDNRPTYNEEGYTHDPGE